jgi:hypothetical protein
VVESRETEVDDLIRKALLKEDARNDVFAPSVLRPPRRHAKSASALIAKQPSICCKRVAENKGSLDTYIRFLARQSYGPARVCNNDLKRPAARPKIAMPSRAGLYRRLLMGPFLSRPSYECGVTVFLGVSAPRMLHRV